MLSYCQIVCSSSAATRCVQDRRRQLLYVERQLQRRLVNEFRSQVRELEPVLHMRGRM